LLVARLRDTLAGEQFHAVPQGPAAVTGQRIPGVPRTSSMHNRPVLLVDGDEDARIILRRLLEHHGYPVIEEVECDAALAAAHTHEVALIVTELYIARGNNVACLIECVRADARLAGIPVVVVTTQAFRDDELRALAAGSAGYIVKPFAAHEVIHRIEEILSTHGASH
jgi:two-component system chemotaxis response regulator CheY